MTRAEIAAEKVRKAQAKREDEQRKAKEKDATYAAKVRQAKTVEYHEAQKALTRRRHAVGDLAERAGLFAWSNAELSQLFALLAMLAPYPNPVAVLEGLLLDVPECLAEALLTAPDRIPSEICTGPEGKFPYPPLETSDESDCKEAKKKGLAAAGVSVQG